MVIGRVVVWVPSEADRVEGRAREEVPPDWRERDMVRRRVGRGRERMVDVVWSRGVVVVLLRPLRFGVERSGDNLNLYCQIIVPLQLTNRYIVENGTDTN